MEIADVRRSVVETIERAKRAAAERRTRSDEAAKEYATFLEHVATPLFRQVAGALKSEGYAFSLFTPSGALRLMSDKSSEDFIELVLDTAGAEPVVLGHSKRTRGRRVIETERPIGTGAVRDLTERQLLDYLLGEITPLVER